MWDTHKLVAIIGCASTCSYRVMVDADCLVFSKRSTAGDIPKSPYTTFKFHSADGVQYSVKIGYEYNGSSSDCIENQLLRSVGEYNDNGTQNRYLRDYLCRLLTSISHLYTTTTYMYGSFYPKERQIRGRRLEKCESRCTVAADDHTSNLQFSCSCISSGR